VDIQSYIESGILERYCLGELSAQEMQSVELYCRTHPEIEKEITVVKQALQNYSATMAMAPPPGLQNKIWDTIANLEKEKELDLNDLPEISRFSDHRKWLGLVKPFIPLDLQEDRIIKLLRQSEKIIQMLVVSRTDFDSEVHVHEQESFIILDGECECTVGEDIFRLQAGGYTEIPLHTPHDVRIISPYVVAILQRVAV